VGGFIAPARIHRGGLGNQTNPVTKITKITKIANLPSAHRLQSAQNRYPVAKFVIHNLNTARIARNRSALRKSVQNTLKRFKTSRERYPPAKIARNKLSPLIQCAKSLFCGQNRYP
jgi:hypothetical protein